MIDMWACCLNVIPHCVKGLIFVVYSLRLEQTVAVVVGICLSFFGHETWLMVYEGCVIPRPYALSLGRTNKICRNTGHYIWCRLSCSSYQKVVSVDSQLPSGLHSRFSVWIYFHSLLHVWIWSQGSRGLKSGLSFPIGLFSRFDELHLPEALLLLLQPQAETHDMEAFFRLHYHTPTMKTFQTYVHYICVLEVITLDKLKH